MGRIALPRLRARHQAPPDGPAPRVIILGAGMSGLCAAIRLRGIGVRDITILERSDGVGGTWRDNHYPGSGCDVPSHLYSYSFAPNLNWTRKFSPQHEILAYFERIADDYDLRPLCRFGVEVTEARFDETDNVWRIETAEHGEFVGDVFIAATGQLNRPFIPDLPGLDRFEGTVFHSARWDHDHDLTGERVGVVGTGASAIQFVPHVARQAAELTLFQRSPNWVAPKPDRAFTPRELLAFRRIPGLAKAYRFSIYARFEMRFNMMMQRSWMRPLLTKMFVKELSKLVSDRTPRAAVIPDYPLGCKRILISDDWYPAILAPTTTIELEPIAEVVPDGIVTTSGTHHRLDTIIFGTGFQTTKFLTPIAVTGPGGADLHETWAKGASAHLGMTVSGFPNLFILYGPNTNLGHNSIIFMTERQMDHVVRCVENLWRSGADRIELRREVMAASDAEIQRRAARTVWVAGCDSWYKDEAGRLTNNWPAHTYEFWRRAVKDPTDDYELTEART